MLTAVLAGFLLLFSTMTLSEDDKVGYDTGGFKETPFEDLPPMFHFTDRLRRDDIGFNWMLESNVDGSYTLNFLPDRDLKKREMQTAHERACMMSRKFPGFTLKGTAFYLLSGILYGSPCIRPDGKGMRPDRYKSWGGSQHIRLPK